MSTVTTSWRRLSDESWKHASVCGIRGRQAPPLQVDDLQQVATWENEGGHSALSTEPARILIIDDDIKSARSLTLMLRQSGYLQIHVAYSGHAALAIAADFQPTMVLLDLGLLDMSSYAVARILRERTQSHALRLIALTSGRELAGRERARVAGFERYLLKPVSAPDLAGLIADTE